MFGGNGSTLNLSASEHIIGHVGVETNSRKASLAKILLVYDVLIGLTLQARLGKMSPGKSERESSKTLAPVPIRGTKTVLETKETELLISSLQDMEVFKTENLVEVNDMR